MSEEITNANLMERLDVLIQAICGTGKFEGQSHSYRMGEFTMQIPANGKRDADLVLSDIGKRFKKMEIQLADIQHWFNQDAGGGPLMDVDDDGFTLTGSEQDYKSLMEAVYRGSHD